MWIFCGFGYFSVIEHRKDKDLLLVRSRVKGDLEQLKAKCLPVFSHPIMKNTFIGNRFFYRPGTNPHGLQELILNQISAVTALWPGLALSGNRLAENNLAQPPTDHPRHKGDG